MIPDNELSSAAVISGFSFPVKQPGDELVDWELAGVYLNDPSLGLLVKLWRVDAVANADTGLRDIIVTAPGGVAWGESSRVLFSGADITEVALSFDQNMNPFVAYTQGSAAKIYWYDPTLPGMTHTTLPVGVVTMRCTLDDKREVATSGSDIILSYIRAGNLCVRYQNERYTVEHVLRAGVGAGAELVSLAMNNGSRLQWRLRGYALSDDPGALIQAEPFLADVVEDLCRKAGLSPQQIDVTELWDDTVKGLGVSSDEGLDKPIEQLMDVFFFGKSEHDRKIYFPKRGREPVARIPYSDLVAGNPKAVKQKRVDEVKLAREVNVNHIDPDGGFAKNKQFAQRRSNLINAEAKKNIETQVVLTVDQAATVAETTLRADWNELVGYEFATTIKWTELTPGDVVEVEDELGTWHRMRLETRNEDGVIDWEGTQDAGARTYGRTYGGNSLPPPVSTTPGLTGETLLEIVNVSPLLDQNDELGLYIAAAGVPGSSWTGFQLLVSVDGGLAYTEAMRADAPSTIGETTTDLPAEAGHDIVSSETVEVTTNFPLASITSAQLAAGQNRIVFGDELGQFETATLLGMVGTLYNYELSGLRRAKYGTPALALPAGTRIVLIDETVAFVQAQRAMIGVDLHYKPVSYGLTEDDTIATAYLFNEPHSQLEWVPDSVAGARDIVTNDIAVTFVGRPRLGQFGTPFHSKYFRGYRITFSDAHVIETMAETAVYAAAPPGVTFVVCGLNEITGAGPASATTVPV